MEDQLTAEQLGELEQYYLHGTPGKWFRGEGRYSIWTRLPDVDGEKHERYVANAGRMPDSGLIVEIHNALPKLLTMARRVAMLERMVYEGVRLIDVMAQPTWVKEYERIQAKYEGRNPFAEQTEEDKASADG